MELSAALESAEKYLGRLHLIWWLTECALAIGAAVVSSQWATTLSWPWFLVALAAFGGLVATAVILTGGMWFGLWVADRIRAARRRGIKVADPPEPTIQIVLGSEPPYQVVRPQLHGQRRTINIGVRNSSATSQLTNCALILESITGMLSDRCPVEVMSAKTINPDRPEYVPFVTFNESTTGPKPTDYRGIVAHFPINPLSGGQSYLDHQPYDLTLVATAAQSAPFTKKCRLWVDDGILKLEEVLHAP